jgi:hypothetical protein
VEELAFRNCYKLWKYKMNSEESNGTAGSEKEMKSENSSTIKADSRIENR